MLYLLSNFVFSISPSFILSTFHDTRSVQSAHVNVNQSVLSSHPEDSCHTSVFNVQVIINLLIIAHFNVTSAFDIWV